ncbi:unnamed protein product [Effrenium voratum]|nr:unnamed protein product [Effrenium voratum]
MVHDGWMSLAGTLLSGLGTTLNGISTLYGLSSQVPVHLASDASAVATGMAGTAVSAWWAAKAGASVMLGGNAAFSTVGFGASCVYVSWGLWHFLRTVAKLSTDIPPKHAPVTDGRFPAPAWLNRRVLNWAVVGRVGVGKSTLINTLRGVGPRENGAAPVGVGHTTKRPKPYSFSGDLAQLTRNMARVWDVPGAGTKDWPAATYVRDAGLRHFDGVLLVTAGAFSETEEDLLKQLEEYKVPCYIVRNKVDQDAINNAQDNDMDAEDTLAEIRQELLPRCDPKRIFLVSAKHPECSKFDFQALLHRMAEDVAAQRAELPEFSEELLPRELQAKCIATLDGDGVPSWLRSEDVPGSTFRGPRA